MLDAHLPPAGPSLWTAGHLPRSLLFPRPPLLSLQLPTAGCVLCPERSTQVHPPCRRHPGDVHPGDSSCRPGHPSRGQGSCGTRALPLRLQLCLLLQRHRVPLQPLPADLLARVPEELGASSALLLDEHFPVLPQTAGQVRGTGRGLCCPRGPPAPARRRPLTQCPVSRARTSSPDVIFPEIWLMLVLPPKKGCGDTPETMPLRRW